MTFEEFKEELEKLGLVVWHDKDTNCILISKKLENSFVRFPFDGHIEDIEAPNGLGMLEDEKDTLLMFREYISLYLSTPIHKRSKYSKYYLKLNDKFDESFGYLGYVTDSKKYVFDHICQDNEYFQSQFTDIEIEKMPETIQSMIRIGVLNKVKAE